MKKLTLRNLPLIDMVKLTGVYIDFDKSEANNASCIKYTLNNETGVLERSVYITDEVIELLNYTENSKCNRLCLTINDKDYGNLLCCTVDELKVKLEKVKQHLHDKYQLEADFTNLLVYYVEICKTFELEDADYNKYFTIVDFMLLSMPKSAKLQYQTISRITQPEITFCTHYAKSKFKRGKYQHEVKFYNKSKEMAETKRIHLDSTVMRFEITCKNAESIKLFFGTNKVWEFDQAVLNERFSSWIASNIVKPTDACVVKSKKYLVKLLKYHYTNDSKNTFIANFLDEVNALCLKPNRYIVSVNFLCEVVDDFVSSMELKNSAKRTKKKWQLKKTLREKVLKHHDLWKNDVCVKVKELAHKLE